MGPAKRPDKEAGTLADIELSVFEKQCEIQAKSPNQKPRQDKLVIYREEQLYVYRIVSVLFSNKRIGPC